MNDFENTLIQNNYKLPKEVNIFVIGDIMLDHYVLGNINRISPEAPVMILDVEKEEFTLGGAGNVIQNLRTMGFNVTCYSIIGKDSDGLKIIELLDDLKVNHNMVIDSRRRTTRKTRYVTLETKSQLLRVDREQKIINEFQFNLDLSDYDIIIVSDYAKGTITSSVMNYLKSTNKKIIVDPKPENSHLYDDIFMITPNRKEFLEMNPYPKNIEYTLKTLGKDGIKIINNFKTTHIQGKEVQVFNVSGCGDTVVAVVAGCISIGIDINTATEIANDCAGSVATKAGTDPIETEIFHKIAKCYLNRSERCIT